MSLDQKIKEALKRLNKLEALVFSATVTAFDEAKKTVTVKDVDGLEFFDVRLSAAEDAKNSLFIIPKVESSVLVAQIGNDLNTLFVIAINEVEKITGVFKALDVKDEADFDVKLSNGEMVLNGGALGGLVKAKDLKQQVDKNTAILEALKNYIQSWTPIPEDGGAAFKNLLSGLTGMNTADLTNIENEKIKHG